LQDTEPISFSRALRQLLNAMGNSGIYDPKAKSETKEKINISQELGCKVFRLTGRQINGILMSQ
jgi:hypothetical protein